MSYLVLDNREVEATWAAIQGRISRHPTFQVVAEDAIHTIESVIMLNHDEAFDRWPTNALGDKKCRVHFWKEQVLESVENNKRGLFAVYFHEYVAASIRGEMAMSDDDDSPTIPSYGGHARAAYDAYVASVASLT
jgi:hypothetical protein